MTVTDKTTLAATAWAYITRADGPMPPLIARDWLMDHAECERDDAVKLLADAAADGMDFSSFPGNRWDWTPSEVVSAIRRLDFYVCDMRIKNIRVVESERDIPGTQQWLVWCDRADRAIAILRELAAPDS